MTAKAVISINRATEDLVAWCNLVRDPEKPWAFRWSKESVRDSNVGACNYILAAARRCGVLDRISTPEQKRQGAEWIRSLSVGENTFSDPALVNRKPPNWNDAEENWPPDSGHTDDTSVFIEVGKEVSQWRNR